eukprot:1622471-Rhodomonas_salina.1
MAREDLKSFSAALDFANALDISTDQRESGSESERETTCYPLTSPFRLPRKGIVGANPTSTLRSGKACTAPLPARPERDLLRVLNRTLRVLHGTFCGLLSGAFRGMYMGQFMRMVERPAGGGPKEDKSRLRSLLSQLALLTLQ